MLGIIKPSGAFFWGVASPVHKHPRELFHAGPDAAREKVSVVSYQTLKCGEPADALSILWGTGRYTRGEAVHELSSFIRS